MALKVTIDKGELVIRITMNAEPEPSVSGKTLVVASTHGNVECGVKIDGKPLRIGVNAYVPK